MTDKEKLMLIAKVIGNSIRVINENHVYSFNNRTYKQRKGGATGLRLNGIIARLQMDYWAKELKILMNENQIVSYSNTKYVDDNNQAL